MSPGDPICELRGVTKRYSRTAALAGVDLNVWPGELVALVGPSGAGKSTLLNLTSGALFPTDGVVRVFGEDLSHLSPRQLRRLQRDIGMIHQQFHLVNPLKVIHNVNAGHLAHWSFFKACLSLVWPLEVGRAAEALSRVGIADKLHERTDQLSGGEQQRVALARVLVQDPQILLADEPISSLDPEHSRAVMDLLRELNEARGKTVILSLHDFNFALSHCQRLIGLRQGRIFFDEPVSRVSPELVRELYRLEWGEQGSWPSG